MIKVYHKQPVPTHGKVREFSQEIHGDNFKELANEYAKTNANNVESVEDTEAPAKASVKEIKAKLTELGIEFKGNASREELEALLPVTE